jgi:hypothetical protein
MSSTLFGRGTHTQVGSAARYERMERELSELRKAIGGASMETELKAIREKALTLERKIDYQLATMNTTVKQLREIVDKQAAQIKELSTIVVPPTS